MLLTSAVKRAATVAQRPYGLSTIITRTKQCTKKLPSMNDGALETASTGSAR